MSDQSKIKLGDRVRDRITGFEGIVLAKTEWLYGCNRVSVKPETLDKDGKPLELETFDEMQLEVLGSIFEAESQDNGGPQDDRLALRR